ncbi:MAG: hypothetical protein IKW35_05325 [Paludibacteraceae bacterium]|nr:hypothetical protein [Paludibacteraceae bacterium]
MKKITLFLSAMLFSVMSFASTATISFADKAQRTSLSDTQQVWEQNGLVVTNDKASSTNNVADYANPARFYKGSSLTIECTLGNITKIEVTCNTAAYATALQTSVGAEATVAEKLVTIVPSAESATYVVAALTAQVRVNELTVTYGEGGETPENPDPEDPEDPEEPEQPENPEPENPTGTVTFDADVDKGNATETQAEYEVIKDGVTMTVSSGRLGTYNNEVHYRIYKNQTLTLTSTAGNIVKVEFTCTGNDDAQYGPGCFTASAGDYNYSGPVGTWTGSDSEVVFTATTNQVRATQVVVTLGEGGGDNPGGNDDPVTPEVSTTITGLKEADAVFVADAEYGDYWAFDLFAGVDEEMLDYVYPELYVMVNESYGKTTINGTYNVLYSEYFPTADSEGIYTDEEAEDFVGTLTIKNVDNNGNYSFKGSFTATDGKTYTYDQVVKVTAYEFMGEDEEGYGIYEDLTLSESGDTPDNPDTPVTPAGMITCAEAASIAAAENYKGTENVTVYGYVVELGSQKVDDKTGRNKQTFWLSDVNGGEKQFQAFWAFVPDYFEVGDKVAITGILQNYKGTIEISDGEAVLLNETGVEDVLVENTPVKVLKNGQMYIMQGNKVYTIMGTQVK